MAFDRENTAAMPLNTPYGSSDRDTPLLAKKKGPRRGMGIDEIRARTALSRPHFAPKEDEVVTLPSDLLEIDMPDVTVELSPGLSVTFSPYDFLPNGNSAPEVQELSLPDDLIFFYHRGQVSRVDSIGDRESLLNMLRDIPFVFVLQIDKNLPVPQDWISTLEGLENFFDNKFYFVCINAKMQSSGMLYVQGKLDSFFELSHTGNCVAHGDLLRRMLIERINLSSAVPKSQADIKVLVSLVMNGDEGKGRRDDRVAGVGEVPKPDLSSLPKVNERALDGWLSTGTLRPRER